MTHPCTTTHPDGWTTWTDEHGYLAHWSPFTLTVYTRSWQSGYACSTLAAADAFVQGLLLGAPEFTCDWCGYGTDSDDAYEHHWCKEGAEADGERRGEAQADR